jgi:secondary thiamine-phosphate synthase enzyme
MIHQLSITTHHQGLYEFTHQAQDIIHHANIETGLATFFIRHTSASLVIQENADPSCQHDLEDWLNRLVPERDDFSHNSEGADDMPAHIKTALTATSINIPIMNGNLALGTWQGIFLWEHRSRGHSRNVLIHIAK